MKVNGDSSQKYTGQYCCLCWAEGREWKSASKTAITLLSETETGKGKTQKLINIEYQWHIVKI